MEKSDPTPLIYDNSISPLDLSSIQRILLVSSNTQSLHTYANTTTFAIVYDSSSSTDEVLALIRLRFQASQLTRFGFAFHYGGNNTVFFMNSESWFQESDLEESQTCFSTNVQFMFDLLREFTVTNVDFLGCSTLNDDKWQQYYHLIQTKSGVVVGASDNNTGNIKYGGDWIMESTMEDIRDIYFTTDIADYASLLSFTLIAEPTGWIDPGKGLSNFTWNSDGNWSWIQSGQSKTGIPSHVVLEYVSSTPTTASDILGTVHRITYRFRSDALYPYSGQMNVTVKRSTVVIQKPTATIAYPGINSSAVVTNPGIVKTKYDPITEVPGRWIVEGGQTEILDPGIYENYIVTYFEPTEPYYSGNTKPTHMILFSSVTVVILDKMATCFKSNVYNNIDISPTDKTSTKFNITTHIDRKENVKSNIYFHAHRGETYDTYAGYTSNQDIITPINSSNGCKIVFGATDTQTYPFIEGWAGGGINATYFSTFSDYRIKSDIKKLDEMVVSLDELVPVKYTLRNTNKPCFGLIAHEVQPYFPEMVRGDKDGKDIQSVDYIQLIPILIHEIKLLKDKSQKQEERIRELESSLKLMTKPAQ